MRKILENFVLLTVGSFLVSTSVTAIAADHGFLTGSILGLGLLIWYNTGLFSSVIWFGILSVPLIIIAWFTNSKRFFFYSLYGSICITLWGSILPDFTIPIESDLYAAIASGVMLGMGNGIMLRSQGSSGGLDYVSVLLNDRFNIPMGRVQFTFNSCLFLFSAFTIQLDLIIVSFIQVYLTATMIDYVLTMFNQRKQVFIITDKGQELCNRIMKTGARATIIPCFGSYSHDPKDAVMTVVTNLQIRRLEETVRELDSGAMFIVENTFYVSGTQYPRRKY